MRWKGADRRVIVSNFDAGRSYALDLKLPGEVVAQWGLKEGAYPLEEMLYGAKPFTLNVSGGQAAISLELAPLESVILRLQP